MVEDIDFDQQSVAMLNLVTELVEIDFVEVETVSRSLEVGSQNFAVVVALLEIVERVGLVKIGPEQME